MDEVDSHLPSDVACHHDRSGVKKKKKKKKKCTNSSSQHSLRIGNFTQQNLEILKEMAWKGTIAPG